MNLQEKIRNMYETIAGKFYLCRPDMQVAGEKFNSALLFGILTELNRGTMIYFGQYSKGKTTSAQYLHCLFHNMPLELIRRKATLKGTPHLVPENYVAFPDYSAMNTGDKNWKDNPCWEHYCMLPWKILNEITRVPEATQSGFLDQIETGEWSYLRGSIDTGVQAVFFTANYADRGSNTVIPALMDRIHMAVEARSAGVANRLVIRKDFRNEKDDVLKDKELYEEAVKVLCAEKPYEQILADLRGVQDKFRGKLKKRGLVTVNDEELAQIESEVEAIPFSKDATIYQAFLMAELDVDPRNGDKRSTEQPYKDNGEYLYAHFQGSDSERAQRAIYRYAQSMAWLQGSSVVSLEHVLAVAPYALWHRIDWTESSKFRDERKNDPLNLYVTKQLLGEGSGEIPGVKKRFMESKDNYQRCMNLIDIGDVKAALEHAKRYAMDGKGHPYFVDLVRELEVEE
jgi:MoxR-like ATPase